MMRSTLAAVAAALLVAAPVAAADAGGVPHWLLDRVHGLVGDVRVMQQANQGRDARLGALEGRASALEATVAQLQARLGADEQAIAALRARQACERPFGVGQAHVRTTAGTDRRVLRHRPLILARWTLLRACR